MSALAQCMTWGDYVQFKLSLGAIYLGFAVLVMLVAWWIRS